MTGEEGMHHNKFRKIISSQLILQTFNLKKPFYELSVYRIVSGPGNITSNLPAEFPLFLFCYLHIEPFTLNPISTSFEPMILLLI